MLLKTIVVVESSWYGWNSILVLGPQIWLFEMNAKKASPLMKSWLVWRRWSRWWWRLELRQDWFAPLGADRWNRLNKLCTAWRDFFAYRQSVWRSSSSPSVKDHKNAKLSLLFPTRLEEPHGPDLLACLLVGLQSPCSTTRKKNRTR